MGKEEKRLDNLGRELHKTICAECGQECEVPFKPKEGRKIYCRDCFQKRRPRRDRRF